MSRSASFLLLSHLMDLRSKSRHLQLKGLLPQFGNDINVLCFLFIVLCFDWLSLAFVRSICLRLDFTKQRQKSTVKTRRGRVFTDHDSL